MSILVRSWGDSDKMYHIHCSHLQLTAQIYCIVYCLQLTGKCTLIISPPIPLADSAHPGRHEHCTHHAHDVSESTTWLIIQNSHWICRFSRLSGHLKSGHHSFIFLNRTVHWYQHQLFKFCVLQEHITKWNWCGAVICCEYIASLYSIMAVTIIIVFSEGHLLIWCYIGNVWSD